MKKLIHTILICILTVNISTNVCNAQKLLTTVKTPMGYIVPDTWDRSFPPQPNMVNSTMKTDMSTNEISAIQKYAAVTYNATLISSQTILYNCHSFAWNMSEQGIICWMGLKTKTAEDIYWDFEKGGYMEVPTEADASKVSYYKDTTNHSAVTTHTLGIVRSKWGDGALYEHPIGDAPYTEMESRKYYKLRVNIAPQNSDIPCYNQTKTFTSPPLNLSGATYTWSCSSNLVTVSGQGTNTYTVRVNSTASQLSWVQLDITHQKFSGNDADISKTSSSTRCEFWVGPPVISNVSGPRYNQVGAFASYSATISDIHANVTSFNWSLMPGTFNNYFNPGYDHCYITWYRAGEYVLTVNAQNTCTSNTYYYPVTVAGRSYLSLSPNPASDNVQVSIIKPQNTLSASDTTSITPTLVTTIGQDLVTTYSIKIYNSTGTIFYSTKKTGDTFTVPVNNLHNGTYFIEANDGKKSYTQQLVVKH